MGPQRTGARSGRSIRSQTCVRRSGRLSPSSARRKQHRMCGILGYTHVRKRLPRGVMETALKSLTHRGPDQQGGFTTELISLGATRLRILDLAGGDQPLISPDGDVIVVFNG